MRRELFPDVRSIVAAVPGFPIFLQCKSAGRTFTKCDGNRDMAAADCFQAAVCDPVFVIERLAVVSIL